MIILGIETSCDETGASVVKDGKRVLSNVVASSQEMHIKTGGIIPEQAARQQIKSILPVINQAIADGLRSTDYGKTKIDAIAVTVGPGLIGSLLVGVETAKTLSYLWKKPIIPVNHLVAHIYANWLDEKITLRAGGSTSRWPKFPLIALVVSGGHTDMVYMKGRGEIKLIGTTRDDAAGECFDKCARILGLPYPGGPAIAQKATEYLKLKTKNKLQMFPRPMIESDDFDFSFSGLKTAVLRTAQKTKNIQHRIPEVAAEIQEAIVDVLVEKTLRAVRRYKPKSLLLGGGVSANDRLREKFELGIMNYELGVKLFIPQPKLCTDNAAVIASCAFFNNKPAPWQKVSANPEVTITNS